MASAPKARYTHFESVLHRLVHERIDGLIVEKAIQLAEGSARKDGAAETAAAYHEALGYTRALRECQNICQEVAADLQRDA